MTTIFSTIAPPPPAVTGRLIAVFVGDVMCKSYIMDAHHVIDLHGKQFRWWFVVPDPYAVVYLQSGMTEREGCRRMAAWILG